MTSMLTTEALSDDAAAPLRTAGSRGLTGQFAVKRGLDVVLSTVLLLVFSPLFVVLAILVKLDSPGPVFFRQRRLGLYRREFTILKFRTMRAGTSDEPHRSYISDTMAGKAGVHGNGVFKLERPNDVTPLGRWLRRSSLDELPQLINVLRGDMSLVGPRPCIEYEVEFFEPHHHERFLVPAGMTGLWQVTDRGLATFREAMELDVAYARSFSLKQDLWILLRTPLKVFRLSGTL
jgi:lipopolysaccharide/colanic/teichoic acid biosynthesis glycosyltransferase